MRTQLRHILEQAKLPRVKVQVLPLAAGAHPGTAGSFAIIRFAETSDPVPYIETIAGDLYLERPEEIRTCNLAWSFLTAKAIGPEESLALIAKVAEEY